MRGCLQAGQPHEQPMSRSSRWAKITVTPDMATFSFGVMKQTRRKRNTAHTYIHEQHSTYLHPRTTQHIPTSTNNTAHTYIHEQHWHTYIHEQHNTYLQPRTTHNFREFRSWRVRRELIWPESWKLLRQVLEFLQRTQKASIKFILYSTPQVHKILSCLVAFLKKFW